MKFFLNRSLLIMAAAESISNLGNWIAMQAIYAMLIFKNGGGVTESAGIFLAGLGPSMLLAPVAGWLCDRFDRRLLMIISELLSAAVVAGMIFAPRLDWIYLLLMLQSACATVMSPARSSIVPDVVAPADLTRANALLMQLNGLTRIGAPLIGAMVVSAVSPQVALWLDVASFLLSAAVLLMLPRLAPRGAAPAQRDAGPKPSLLATLTDALRRIPRARFLFPIMFCMGLIILAYDISASVFVRDILQADIGFKGLLASLTGTGMGLAALGMMLVKTERNAWSGFVNGMLIMTCLPGSFALGTVIGDVAIARGVVLAGCLVGGLGIGLANVQGQVLIQRLAPAGWLGRFTGAIQSVVVGGQIVALLTTPLLVPNVVSFGVYFGIGTLALLIICIRAGFSLGVWRSAGPIAANEVATGD